MCYAQVFYFFQNRCYAQVHNIQIGHNKLAMHSNPQFGRIEVGSSTLSPGDLKLIFAKKFTSLCLCGIIYLHLILSNLKESPSGKQLRTSVPEFPPFLTFGWSYLLRKIQLLGLFNILLVRVNTGSSTWLLEHENMSCLHYRIYDESNYFNSL